MWRKPKARTDSPGGNVFKVRRPGRLSAVLTVTGQGAALEITNYLVHPMILFNAPGAIHLPQLPFIHPGALTLGD